MDIPQYAVLTPEGLRESLDIHLSQLAEAQHTGGSRQARVDAAIDSIYTARCKIGLLTKKGVDTNDLCEIYIAGLDKIRECVAGRIAVLTDILMENWERLVADYHVELAFGAIRDGLPCELWYMLDRRDTIEAHLHLADLHPKLVLPDDMLRRIQMEDRALLRCGAELLQLESQGTAEERAWLHPRAHWWWWLDV